MDGYLRRVISAKKLIRNKIAQINLKRHIEARIGLKETLKRVVGCWKVRRAVNKMIK